MIEQNKIPGNSTEIKENSTWHKVDLSNKKVKHHEIPPSPPILLKLKS